MMLAHLLALATVLIWGVTFISTKVLLENFSAVSVMFIRFLLGYGALWAVGFCNRKRNAGRLTRRFALKTELLFAGAGLTGVTLYFLFENIALTYTYASSVSMIVSASPVFVALFAHFFVRGERIRPVFFAGFTAAMLGIGFITYGGSALLKLNPLGDGLALLAAVIWGIYSTLVKRIEPLGFDIITTTRKTFFYGLLFLIPALFMDAEPINFQALTQSGAVLNLLFLGLGASALCYITWTYAVNKLGATRASAYIYLIPPVTVIASAALLKERITAPAIIGCVMILSGLYLSERVSKKKINASS